MQIAFFNDFELGVIQDDTIIGIDNLLPGMDAHSPQVRLEAVINNWSDIAPRIGEAARNAAGTPLNSVKFCPSVPRPGQLVCAAVNYIEPDRPERAPFNAFLKATSSIVGHQATVELAPAEASVFHFEPELAMIIGKRASRISADEALDHVFGYTQFMDVSARGLGGFFLGKSWHTSGPLGPTIVTADEIADPNKLNVKMWVNDELRHDFSSAEMTRHIPELLAEITRVMPLEPGDVVATGTHHYGLAPVQHEDVVRLQIEGLGPALSVKVHDPLKRSWSLSDLERF